MARAVSGGRLSQPVMKDAIVQYEDGTFEEFDLVVKVDEVKEAVGGGPRSRR